MPLSIESETTQRSYRLTTGISVNVNFPVRSGYTITWSLGDGTQKTQTINVDAPEATFSSPIHTFEAGFYTITATVADGNGTALWTNSTVYKIGPPTVTIINGPWSEIVWSVDGTVERPAEDPVWVGHEFGGWFDDVDRTRPFEWNSTITEDTYAYAMWSNILFTVSFVNGETELYSCKLPYGSHINLDDAGTPSKTGGSNYTYAFDSWNTSADGTGSKLTRDSIVTDDVTYYATYKVRCCSSVNNFISIPLSQMGDVENIEVSGASGWTVVLPSGIFDSETDSVPTLAVQKTNTNSLDKDVRVALSNKDVYAIELSTSLDGNEQAIIVKLPYDKSIEAGVHSFYVDSNGKLVDNGIAEITKEGGVTYAVFTTTHFSTWAIGPSEGGNFDPLESPLSTILILGMIVVTIMVGAPPLIHFLRNRNGGR